MQLGLDAVTELGALLPIVGDADVNAHVQALGRRLAGALPPGISPPAFQDPFEVISAPDVAAVRSV